MRITCLLLCVFSLYNGQVRYEVTDYSQVGFLCLSVVKGVCMKKLFLTCGFALCMLQTSAEERVVREVQPAITPGSAPHYYSQDRASHRYVDRADSSYVYYNPESRRRVLTNRRKNRVPSHRVQQQKVRTISPAITSESAPHYYHKDVVERVVKAPEPCTYESHYIKEVNGGSIRYVMNGRVKVCEPGYGESDPRQYGNFKWGWVHTEPNYIKTPLFESDRVVQDVDPLVTRERYLRDRFSGKRVRDDYYY